MANYIDLPELQDASALVRKPNLSALAKGGNDLDQKLFNNMDVRYISQIKQADDNSSGVRISYTKRNEDSTVSRTYTWVGTLRGGRTKLTGWSNTEVKDFSASYKNVVLTTPEGVIKYAERYWRSLKSDAGDPPYSQDDYNYGTVGNSTPITKNEVYETPEERLDALISQSWAVLGPIAFDDSLGSVRLIINWYEGLNKDDYYGVETSGSVWEGGGPYLVFDQDGWDAKIQERVDLFESLIQSEQNLKTADETDLTQLQAELAELQANEEARNIATWQNSVDQSLATFTEYGNLAVQRNQKLIELYDGGDLTDAERDQLEEEIDALKDQMDDIRYFGNYGANFYDSANQAIMSKQREIARKTENISVHQAQIDYYTAIKTAIQSSPTADNHYIRYTQDSTYFVARDYYDDRSFNQSTSEGRTKTSGRYKIVVEGPPDLRTASAVDVQWAETTQPDDTRTSGGSAWAPNPTRAYKKTTLNFSAGQSEAASGWYDVGAPALGTKGIIVGTPFYTQKGNVSYGQGVEARKFGFYGYEPSQPPKIYRKEVWSGGHSGCPASGLDPVDYAWETGALTTEEQQALGSYPKPPAIYKTQPLTMGSKFTTYDPLMNGSKLPASTMNARTWLDTTFKCGEGDDATDVAHTFETELVDELTSANLKSFGDEYVEDYFTWIEGDGAFADRPLFGDYGSPGYALSYLQDYDDDVIFNQLLDGRIKQNKIALAYRDRDTIQAINFLSSDETLYLKKTPKWQSELNGSRANLPDAVLALKFTRYTINLDTNEVTEQVETRNISATQDPQDNPPYDYYFQMPYELLEAPEQCFVILADFYVSVDESNWGTANSVYDTQVLFDSGNPEVIDVRIPVTDP